MSETTAIVTERTCPPSAVADKILTWTDSEGELLVFPGDLVLDCGHFAIIHSISDAHWPTEQIVEFSDGRQICVTRDSHVAVRRYDTGEETR
jgi:hypothetical protein